MSMFPVLPWQPNVGRKSPNTFFCYNVVKVSERSHNSKYNPSRLKRRRFQGINALKTPIYVTSVRLIFIPIKLVPFNLFLYLCQSDFGVSGTPPTTWCLYFASLLNVNWQFGFGLCLLWVWKAWVDMSEIFSRFRAVFALYDLQQRCGCWASRSFNGTELMI